MLRVIGLTVRNRIVLFGRGGVGRGNGVLGARGDSRSEVVLAKHLVESLSHCSRGLAVKYKLSNEDKHALIKRSKNGICQRYLEFKVTLAKYNQLT